jgi:hypothetical protein
MQEIHLSWDEYAIGDRVRHYPKGDTIHGYLEGTVIRAAYNNVKIDILKSTGMYAKNATTVDECTSPYNHCTYLGSTKDLILKKLKR